MKKRINIIIIFLIINVFIMPIYAFDMPFKKKTEKAQIKEVLIKHSKAMDKHDIEEIKTFYDVDYKSADGFDLDTLIEMLEKTYKTYDNIKYKTKINNISAYDNWALVQISDESSARVFSDSAKTKEKMGVLEGKSVYNVYLRKNKDSDWKIFYDDIIMEETSLKYGIANKLDINLTTPVFVENGGNYDLTLKMNKPEDIIALGAISREEISYPPKEYPEKFRKISQEGELERVVKANNRNLDEYAIASVGFTKVSLNEAQSKARIEILGMAYILKRINMEKMKETPKNER